ncbi:phosphatidylserine decarboxylase [Candidatus Latescibacterota bacterium]
MVRMDPDGVRLSGFMLIIAGISGMVFAFGENSVWGVVAVLFCALTLFSAFFFRDPERTPPPDTDAVVSAADGVVVDVALVPAERFDGDSALRIAVFMNVFDVHVNRSPVDGVVRRVVHSPGKKGSAMNPRAGHENEYGDTDIETKYGIVRIRQIAGLVARRVVTRVKEGDILARGDRIGLIRFGSRVDVFLPVSFEPVAARGGRVRAGESIIAKRCSS